MFNFYGQAPNYDIDREKWDSIFLMHFQICIHFIVTFLNMTLFQRKRIDFLVLFAA
jgi:hypothetical protein